MGEQPCGLTIEQLLDTFGRAARDDNRFPRVELIDPRAETFGFNRACNGLQGTGRATRVIAAK